MKKNKLAFITRCTRPENLSIIAEAIKPATDRGHLWRIIFDLNVDKLDPKYIDFLNGVDCEYYFRKSDPAAFSHDNINWVIQNKIPSGYWIHVIDDDNIPHENLVPFFEKLKSPTKVVVVDQRIEGKDFTGLYRRVASHENTKVRHIDMAQIIIDRDFILEANGGFDFGYTGDGTAIEKIHELYPEEFTYVNRILAHYNYIEKPKMGSEPRVLYVGELPKTPQEGGGYFDYESNKLNIKHIPDDKNISEEIYNFNPDAIITRSANWQDFTKMASMPYDVRRRWYHYDNSVDDNKGWYIYNVANNFIMNRNEDLASIFTSAYNTGENIYVAYNSLARQTYTNWEWVVVNDSTDGGKTQKLLEEIAKKDPRVKIYSFDKKSGGVIGEAKYRAAMLCDGNYLMEFDHDDALMPDAIELMVRAFKEYPDAGFVYSDCIECDLNFNVNKYPPGFALGYGFYYQEEYQGRMIDVNGCVPVNPKTIRHIVGVPNHFRSWRRSHYHEIGGHNRRLTIADDYELIVRSFLSTRFVRIPKCEYIQYYYGQNTQDSNGGATRKDIQRRVRSIAEFYNEKIKTRFEELGMIDWAYEGNPQNPLYTPSVMDAPDAAYTLII